MASTTLFAPQVRSVQPAFIYSTRTKKDDEENDVIVAEGTVKIYFNLSSYNNIDDVKFILYTIVDPNQVSSWGTNSIIKNNSGFLYQEFLPIQDLNTGEFYLTIDFNNSDYKILTKNQFYQVQLYLADTDTSAPETIITKDWLNTYQNNISEPSQVTLIRPINQPIITIDGDDGETYDFSKLTGSIKDNIETFDSYYCIINGHKFGPVQGNGKYFSIPIDNSIIKEGPEYSGTFYYTTIHGYSFPDGQDFTITYNKPASGGPEVMVSLKPIGGGINLTTSSNQGVGKLQRHSEDVPGYWETIYTSTSETLNYTDYTVESFKKYKYRLVNNNKTVENDNEYRIEFDDIFLSDETGMIAVRLNPNISGLKYIKQESITNTLGGKYPIIRKNGDTKYRQFSLSGTIDCGCYDNSTVISDSTEKTFSDKYYSDVNLGSLYLTDTSKLDSLIQSLSSATSSEEEKKIQFLIEKKIKMLTMDFFTNGNPKLFRSFEEGNIIVYLSNVSFTPNKSLGRHICDFSTTVTEICDYNSQNLKKYKLNLGGYNLVARGNNS